MYKKMSEEKIITEKKWTFKYFIKEGYKEILQKAYEIINIGTLVTAGACAIAYLHWIPGVIVLGCAIKYAIDTFLTKK